ncbi:PRC-barrel domain containing protein [Halomonas denitrificans]|uniref:PRC-barrel domain containing protein n=1 Tax=Halomonas TaxID=2745 RepID=UPI001A8F601C|nr:MULTISPECIES: PRC-barrel domain containing protein [Halomonas]MED5295133.1 PRC-barrel domain containing protein [Pseudomonadota bacterium]MBN8411488.1 PRC-barrel domain containing protein [Halomonas litopenaei]MBY5923996.1 PRC-barrel domain containing protein [Halomonas sp. DP4Y7-2]MBY5928149.1 PRC-barrel domain containing protein [Halomonas sp. DP8Y7-3]MBY5967305.1 PRC-barrel domain containing protein [Halomonas denitrificans]
MIRKNLLTTAIASTVFAGSMAVGTTALADHHNEGANQAAHSEPQGLYSAEELLDADVFAKGSSQDEVGEVEDILLDNDMKIRAIVVEAGDLLDLGENQYVVETGDFTVQTTNGDSLDNIEYSVHLNITQDEISAQPEYTNTWWNQTKTNVQQAWMDTKEGAQSAWQTTKSATANALTSAGNAIENAGDNAEDAAQDAAN